MSELLFKTPAKIAIFLSLLMLIAACAASPEIQAKKAEYARTIPNCNTEASCQTMWAAARRWVVQNASFGIRVDSDNRIDTYNAQNTQSGTAIRVDKIAAGDGSYQIMVDIECFAIYGCPLEWDSMLDFNRVVAAAGQEPSSN